MEYIEIGKCIWCHCIKPECTFLHQPHTIPKSLGGQNIGFDICDVCNDFFGKADAGSITKISIEVCLKEIFNIIRFLLDIRPKDKDSYKRLKSVFFSYRHSERKIVINKKFKFNRAFEQEFARNFKRAMCEIFLQEFHYYTKKGLETRFDAIRRFARYDQGNIPLYYVVSRGIYLVPLEMSIPNLSFNENTIEQIDLYGFYTLFLFGYLFFLEVTPRAELCRDIFLKKQVKELNVGGFVNEKIIPLEYISQLDFTLRNLHN